MILNKLKKITQRALIYKDKETLEDLQWVIKTMSENNLHEPEIINHFTPESNNLDIMEHNMDPGQDFLSKYSKRESIQIMELDLVKTKSKKSTRVNHSE